MTKGCVANVPQLGGQTRTQASHLEADALTTTIYPQHGLLLKALFV